MIAEQDDDDIPLLAVKALTEATDRAMKEGLPQVFARDGELVRVEASGITVLKQLPPHVEVTDRVKRTGS